MDYAFDEIKIVHCVGKAANSIWLSGYGQRVFSCNVLFCLGALFYFRFPLLCHSNFQSPLSLRKI
jgi:hypothetical protein